MSESGIQLALVGSAKAYNAATDWKQRWEDCIRVLAELPGQEFTADIVRDIAGEPDDHPNAAGAIFMRLARQKVIEPVGYQKSSRPKLHNHPIQVWRGVQT